MNISDEHRTLFSKQMEKILYIGGMMNFEVIGALGREIALLKPVKIFPEGNTWFHFNYFEDRCWESAEYNAKEGWLYTGKVGCAEFADVILAAYTLFWIYDNFEGTVCYSEWDEGESYDAYCRWVNHLLGKELPTYSQARLREIDSIRTSDFLAQEDFLLSIPLEVRDKPEYVLTDDDRLYWWDDSEEVRLSEEMDEWLSRLAARHKAIKKEKSIEWSHSEYPEEKFLRPFVDADRIYRHIHPFQTMFYNFMDKRMEPDYRAAMDLFAQLIDENKEEGSIIALETRGWDITSRKITHNPARLKIKRYLAVMANQRLREKYFGF